MVLAGTARAQMWLDNRQYNEGPGIWLTDGLVLHPGIGLEGGYDTNPLHRSTDVIGSPLIQIGPYIDLATEPPQRKIEGEEVVAEPPVVDFRWGVAGTWDYFFSSNSEIKKQSDIGVDTTLNLELFPRGSWTLILFDNYVRTLESFETASEVGFNNDNNVGQLSVRFTPGGRAMEFQLGYANHLYYFEAGSLGYGNHMGHEVMFDYKWKFFPKTAFLFKARFEPITYSENYNSDSMPLRTWAGLQGLFTDKFGMLILLGYGNGFYDKGPNFNSFIGRVEADYFIGTFSSFKIGIMRDFVDSIWANYYDKIGGYIRYNHLLIQALLLAAEVGVYYQDYANTPLTEVRDNRTLTYSSTGRSDVSVEGGLLIEYRVLDWLAFNVSGKYTSDFTDFSVTSMDQTRKMSFQKFEVLGGARFSY